MKFVPVHLRKKQADPDAFEKEMENRMKTIRKLQQEVMEAMEQLLDTTDKREDRQCPQDINRSSIEETDKDAFLPDAQGIDKIKELSVGEWLNLYRQEEIDVEQANILLNIYCKSRLEEIMKEYPDVPIYPAEQVPKGLLSHTEITELDYTNTVSEKELEVPNAIVYETRTVLVYELLYDVSRFKKVEEDYRTLQAIYLVGENKKNNGELIGGVEVEILLQQAREFAAYQPSLEDKKQYEASKRKLGRKRNKK